MAEQILERIDSECPITIEYNLAIAEPFIRGLRHPVIYLPEKECNEKELEFMTPEIIAHRGASYLAPENTLSAFRKAMEIGADGVEMDVQKTYDNELVIHHDNMVDMHTDISGQIYDLTMG